ncbi:glycosyltransferase [Dactylosporangium aurantiacum]|uniref:Glycosyltransferase n=1 Tax=Dactylosporangium aurantiacum TaxID=35754 RepID=A0A9Q9IJ63_9ACTN|nr:glycosyltransferase [Dactylosporangium aurantiacum]MDG6100824.1 glycosyltransferase [Dactylosporangium aurantiacum]UWZ55115.1 glycosyltransferase [Dactylosporangium aurantiacum]
MRLVVSCEQRYVRTPDGRVWSTTGGAYDFWQRYLTVFDEVRVVARVAERPGRPPDARRVDGEHVTVRAVPHYVGPLQYLLRLRGVRAAVRTAVEPGDAALLRVPSPIGTLLHRRLRRRGWPFGLEVVGDPYDVFAPEVMRHPLRPLLRAWFTARLRFQCRTAVAVAYVTERALQSRYPAAPGAVTAAYSSIQLDEPAFVDRPRAPAAPKVAVRLVSVGSLEMPYKGIDTLIEALPILVRAGLEAHLVHLGDGRCRPDLERLVRQRRLGGRVAFAGAVPPGAAVRLFLDDADLFVLPSRTEGLPRALIEAMARALPAVGTRVGGTPELLDPAHLVPPDDPVALAYAITALVADPAAAAAASRRNLARARGYAADTLARRRTDFYRALRVITQPAQVKEVVGGARQLD